MTSSNRGKFENTGLAFKCGRKMFSKHSFTKFSQTFGVFLGLSRDCLVISPTECGRKYSIRFQSGYAADVWTGLS